MATDVPGVQVGHWTDHEARTGCTVVLFPEGTVASGEVRGGAPASREFDLLAPGRLVQRLDAVVLSGGSAFGLAAADGVASWLAEQGRGFATVGGPVPIVVGLCLFDLGVGDPGVRPGPAEGRSAATAATGDPVAVGAVGAGAGATVGKWRGADQARPGGIGAATRRSGDLVVSALVAVNALGWIDDGTRTDDPGPPVARSAAEGLTNTTIGLVVTNAVLSKQGCQLVAQSAHDGLARSVYPAHALGDGDAFVAAATATMEPGGEVDSVLSHVRVLATAAVCAAVRSVGGVG
jgi:L-aminopeptidase/D-esterase-like protein